MFNESIFQKSSEWLFLCYKSIVLCIKRSSHRRCSVKKVLLEILQNSKENTCARDFFKKENTCACASGLQLYLKKDCEFCEISKKPFFIEHLRWLLLCLVITVSQRSLKIATILLKSDSHLQKKLRYLLYQKPKNDEECFLFHLRSSFCFEDI